MRILDKAESVLTETEKCIFSVLRDGLNHPVDDIFICDAGEPIDPDRDALKIRLQQHISLMRKKLRGLDIVHRGGGYRLVRLLNRHHE